jgi:hypothetical protein
MVGLLGTASAGMAADRGSAATGIDRSQQLAYVVAEHGTVHGLSVQDFIENAPSQQVAPHGLVPLTTTCWYVDDYRYGKNVFGGILFTFHTRTNWCGDGSWIRNYAYTDADASTGFGWAYFGLVQNYDQYGVNWNQFWSVREGQFCLLNCLAQNVHTLIDVLVGPAGQVYRW